MSEDEGISSPGQDAEINELNKNWPVTRDRSGRLLGLPEGILEKDVIVFVAPDGKLRARFLPSNIPREVDDWRG